MFNDDFYEDLDAFIRFSYVTITGKWFQKRNESVYRGLHPIQFLQLL
jgi:hypothetical protein